MRGRAWRRYMEQVVVMRRLRNANYRYSYYFPFVDINGIKHSNPITEDFIGGYYSHMFKTHTIKSSESKYKDKYSPNKALHPWRTKGSLKTREGQKLVFRKILKENGLI